jgi:hypothetical protein
VPTRCPHDLFQGGARAFESAPAFLDRARLSARQKENFATSLTQLVIPSVGDNYRRHETLRRFMLGNDPVTLAVEVPIWLTPADIRALEREHRIALRSEGLPADQAVTGHIDFLQVTTIPSSTAMDIGLSMMSRCSAGECPKPQRANAQSHGGRASSTGEPSWPGLRIIKS